MLKRGKKDLKIMYIITQANLGGAQVHLRDLILGLPKYITPYVVIGEKEWLYYELQKQTVQVHIIKNLVREISPIKDLLTIISLRNVMKLVKPDIVHCHSSKAGFLGRAAAKSCDIPSIFTVHGWAFTEGVSFRRRIIYRFLEKVAANWTARIICVSKYDKILGSKLLSNIDDKLYTIHNGIGDIPFKENVINNCNKKGAIHIIMVARFSSPKEQGQLVQALSILQKEGKYFFTTFVGDGPNLEHVKQLAYTLGIQNEVYFTGARSDVEKLLVGQDLFILISKWEGFPISIIEAMRQGLPVIASNVGGVSEAVIDGETGFLIPRDDIQVLVKKLRNIHDRDQSLEEMGIKGRARFEENFTLEKMVQETVDIYEEVFELT